MPETQLSPKETLRRLRGTLNAAQDFRKWFLNVSITWPEIALTITPVYFQKPDNFLAYTDQLIENLETQILKRQ